jgi:hypothetical protein
LHNLVRKGITTARIVCSVIVIPGRWVGKFEILFINWLWRLGKEMKYFIETIGIDQKAVAPTLTSIPQQPKPENLPSNLSHQRLCQQSS